MKKWVVIIAGLMPVASFHSESQIFPTNYNTFPPETSLGGGPFPTAGVAVSTTDLIGAYRQVPVPGSPDNISLIGMLPLNAFAFQNQMTFLRQQAAQLQQQYDKNRHGIASAIAIANASMPLTPGRTSWAVNTTEFRGAQAIGGSIAHRFDTVVPLVFILAFLFRVRPVSFEQVYDENFNFGHEKYPHVLALVIDV